MNKKILIVPVSENMELLIRDLKEFSIERIHLVCFSDMLKKAEETKFDLDKMNIPVMIHEIQVNIWEDCFRYVGKITSLEQDNTHELIIYSGTATADLRSAITCAGFVNGLKVFSNDETGKLYMLPIMKFSYYNLLTDKKMHLLSLLDIKKETTFEDLSSKSKMSMPLVSYHLNGNLKSEGLKMLGLVQTSEKKGKTLIKLTILGKLLLEGYIKA
jgi:hypothetical protein